MRFRWSVCLVFLVSFVAVPCRGQSAGDDEQLPKVVMIDQYGPHPPDAGLYKAIRAQLSAAALILERVELPEEPAMTDDPEQKASRLAEEQRAAMVFWIEDAETCRMYYFIPDDTGGRITSRDLDIDLTSRASRNEVIAVVASSMIEGLLISRNLRASENTEEEPPLEAPVGRRKWVELAMAYSGTLVAPQMVSHGGTTGLGVFPVERLVVGASVVLSYPQKFVDEELRLRAFSVQLEITAAGRLLIRPVEIRLGLAWFADFRSLAAESRSDTIEPRPEKRITVYSLVPFFCLGWAYRDRFGPFGRLGASLSLNETTYRVSREEPTDAFEPYLVKLFFQVGFFIRL